MFHSSGPRSVCVAIGSCVALLQSPAGAQGVVRAWGDLGGMANLQSVPGTIVKLSAGNVHNAALTADGSVRVWGRPGACIPAVPDTSGPFIDVSCGFYHTAALRANGAVVVTTCESGYELDAIPPGLSGVVAIDAGDLHTLALTSDGSVVSWGRWTLTGTVQPGAPADARPAIAIAANGQSCATLRPGGQVFVWGQLAQIATAPSVPMRAIALGLTHGLGLTAEGNVVSWGISGQPVPDSLGSVIAIDAGDQFSIALRSDGTVIAWGIPGQPSVLAVPSDLPPIHLMSAGRRHATVTTCLDTTLETVASPELAPFAFNDPAVHVFSNLAPGDTGAELEIVARGNLGSATKFLTVRADGTTVASGVFGSGSGASNCSSEPSRQTITIPASTFAAMVADGSITVRVEPSLNATSAGCADATLGVTLRYQRTPVDCDGSGLDDECELTYGDCDRNGALDVCELAAGTAPDCDGDGRVDTCQIATGSEDKNANGIPDACELARGDLNLDGVVDGSDLGGLLALWSELNPPYGDLDRNGVIDGGDLGIMLANWTSVP